MEKRLKTTIGFGILIAGFILLNSFSTTKTGLENQAAADNLLIAVLHSEAGEHEQALLTLDKIKFPKNSWLNEAYKTRMLLHYGKIYYSKGDYEKLHYRTWSLGELERAFPGFLVTENELFRGLPMPKPSVGSEESPGRVSERFSVFFRLFSQQVEREATTRPLKKVYLLRHSF